MKPFTIVDLVAHYYKTSQDPLLLGLFFLIALDILTGLAKAFFTKKLNSSISFEGWGKHTGVAIIGVFIYPILSFIGFQEVATGSVSLAMVTYLISILENLADLNTPMPRWILVHLDKVKDSLEEGKKDE